MQRLIRIYFLVIHFGSYFVIGRGKWILLSRDVWWEETIVNYYKIEPLFRCWILENDIFWWYDRNKNCIFNPLQGLTRIYYFTMHFGLCFLIGYTNGFFWFELTWWEETIAILIHGWREFAAWLWNFAKYFVIGYWEVISSELKRYDRK